MREFRRGRAPPLGGSMQRAVLDRLLVIPSLPPRHVSRPRLLSGLDAAVCRPVTLVAAGPGSGKSVLLSEWAARRRPVPAWISLDRADNSPPRFWAMVAAAFAAAHIPGAVAPVPIVADAIADVLLPALEHTEEQPVVLVLDDAHLLTDRTILAGLDDCVRRWGHRLRLVIAARSDPLLPLHRYRLAGTLSELRAESLAMSDAECVQVLAGHGVTLPPHDLARLATRTEGWAAGIRLCAMNMEGTERASDFVAEFALDRGSVGEYLVEEVLDRQPANVKRLLIETSFLSEVNGSIAQAVTGLSDAGQNLRELSRANSFVLPLDDGLGSYRYHHLLGEILGFLLRHEPGDRRRECIRRAARWYGAHDDLERAVHFAVEGEDLDYAAHLVASGGLARILSERIDVPTSIAGVLVADLPEEPGLRTERILAGAALFALNGRPTCAQGWLDKLAELPVLAGSLAVTEQLVELLIARARHDASYAEIVVGRLTQLDARRHPELLTAIQVELAMTHFYDGGGERVEALLSEACEAARTSDTAALELDCLAQLAHVNAFWGRFPISRRFERVAKLLIKRNPDLEVPAALLYAAAARYLSAAHFASADDAITRCGIAHTNERDHDLRGEIVLLEAMQLSVAGRLTAARDRAAMMSPDTSGLIGDYRTFVLATVEVALGHPERAETILTDHQAQAVPDLLSVASARTLLALGLLDEAAQALHPIVGSSASAVNRPILIDALLADAEIARYRKDDETSTIKTLLRAIDLATDDFVVPFLRTTPTLADLRARNRTLLEGWPASEDIVSAELSGIDVADVAEVGMLADGITDRERAVLRWLATSMSTTEIADELCLSVNTVKTHIAAIYRKVGATRRRDAVERAREFELL
jgi:LuxR family maltose regulon positive regulatory protein